MIYLIGLLLVAGSIGMGLVLKKKLPKVHTAMASLICLSLLLILVAALTSCVFNLFPGYSGFETASTSEFVQH